VGSGLETGKRIFYLKVEKVEEGTRKRGLLKTYSTSLTSRFIRKVWFNTPPQILRACRVCAYAAAQIRMQTCLRRLQKFDIEPDGIINFLARSSLPSH
jgi:hypothetical protein